VYAVPWFDHLAFHRKNKSHSTGKNHSAKGDDEQDEFVMDALGL